MTDEIRTYHVDDPNDAPNRRLDPCWVLPTNPFLQTPLPPYVIAPVANSVQHALRWYMNSAFLQGIAHQQQQQEHLQRQQLEQQKRQQLEQQKRQQLENQQRQQQASQQQDQQEHQERQLQQHLHQQQLFQQHQQIHSAYFQPPPSASSSSVTSTPSTARMASSSSASSSSSSSINLDSPQPDRRNSVSSIEQEQPQRNHEHIKKPLNPFMIFMQKQRPEIVRQGIIKESAAINQLLGQQWKKLSREEQEPYYKLAEEEKLLHAQKYPGWSARDNYANQKKRKKLKLKTISQLGLEQSDKKCRARFGVTNTALWCKPCRRKKKCIYSNFQGSSRSEVSRTEAPRTPEQHTNFINPALKNFEIRAPAHEHYLQNRCLAL